jgi:hypothetical protein
MKYQTRIKIRADGMIEFLGDVCPVDLPLEKATRRRVSTILPTQSAKRIAFRLLRFVAGDRGAVAAWTRTWAGPWRATILRTGDTELFDDRQAAIDWEYSVINSPKFEL